MLFDKEISYENYGNQCLDLPQTPALNRRGLVYWVRPLTTEISIW